MISSTERSPTLENHEWSDLSSNKDKFIYISDISSPHLHVGIHGFTDNTTVTWEATQANNSTKDDTMDLDTQEDHEGKVQCKNCHAWVLERTLPLHENFCLRNNVICPWGCGKVFKKDSQDLNNHWHCDKCEHIGDHQEEEQEKHVIYEHTPKTCICTHFSTDSYRDLAEHRRTICSEKLITCKYCHVSRHKI